MQSWTFFSQVLLIFFATVLLQNESIFFPFLFSVSTDNLNLYLSFAAGGLLGDVFLHLLPEAWAHVHDGNLKKFLNFMIICSVRDLLFFQFDSSF